MDKIFLKVHHLRKTYPQPGKDLIVLEDISFDLQQGEIVALMGSSGSGKSTLLHLIGLLDGVTSGTIEYEGKEYASLSISQKDAFRAYSLGFIYQKHYLLPEFTAHENVMMPLLIQRVPYKEAATRAMHILKKVGLSQRLSHRPWELSGGEQQRVAIARALVHNPFLLLADEPTGNLDEHNADTFFSLLLALVKELKMTTVVATHDHRLASQMDRILYLHEGKFRPFNLKEKSQLT